MPRVTNTNRNEAQNTASRTRILMPASLRLDARVLLLHTTFLWATRAIFSVLLIFKLQGTWENTSWFAIFAPLFVGHALHIPLLIHVLCSTNQRMLQQIGPPPPTSASLGLHAQYTSLRAAMTRSHIIDNTNALLDTSALFIVEILFAYLLSTGRFSNTSLRVVFMPIWVVWVATVILICGKHRRDRVLGSQRDLTYIFLLMVAFKVDGQSSLPWTVVFIVPWLWLCGVLLLGAIVSVSLLCAKFWARFKELIMPIGFMLVLFSTSIPQFAFARNLVQLLDGDTTVTYPSILIPAAVGWAAMWLSSIVLSIGLRARERVREALLASGAVWTAHEALARHLQPAAAREEEQRRIDAMTEQEVLALARDYMRTRGCVTPPALLRVASTLFKLPEDVEPIKSVATSPTTAAVTGSEAHDESSNLSDQNKASSAEHTVIHIPPLPGQVPAGNSSPAPLETSGTTPSLQQQSTPLPHHSRTPGLLRHSATSNSSAVVGHNRSNSFTGRPAGTSSDMGILPSILQSHNAIAAFLGLSEREEPPLQASEQSEHDMDDGSCVICYDAQASCVLMGCGHGGFCSRCAHLLLVRPPGNCPNCRQSIEQVLELQELAPVGQLCTVKQRGDS